jgi:hypothetical protein
MPDLSHQAASEMAWRDRSGFRGVGVLDQPRGDLDPAQRAHLAGLAGRLRMLHDLAATFADRYTAFPAQLTWANTRELAAVRELLGRYRLADRDAGLGPGHFTSREDQNRYDRLSRRGSTGRAMALGVLADLLEELETAIDAVLPRLTAADVRHVYLHLYVATVRQRGLVQAWCTR